MKTLKKVIKSEFCNFDNTTIQKFRNEFIFPYEPNNPNCDVDAYMEKKKESIKSAQERIISDDDVFESFVLDTPRIKKEILNIAKLICEEIYNG